METIFQIFEEEFYFLGSFTQLKNLLGFLAPLALIFLIKN